MRNLTEIIVVSLFVIFNIIAAQANTNSFIKKPLTIYEDFKTFSDSVKNDYPKYDSFFKSPGLCNTNNIKFKFSVNYSRSPDEYFNEINKRFESESKSNPKCLFSIYEVVEGKLRSYDEKSLDQNTIKLQSSFNEILAYIVGNKIENYFVESTKKVIAKIESNEPKKSENTEQLLEDSNLKSKKILDEIIEPKKISMSEPIFDPDEIIHIDNTIKETESNTSDKTQTYGIIGAGALAGIGIGLDPAIAIMGSAFSMGYYIGNINSPVDTEVSFSVSPNSDNFYLNLDFVIYEFENINDNIALNLSQPFKTQINNLNNNLSNNINDNFYESKILKYSIPSEKTNFNLTFKKKFSDNENFNLKMSSSLDSEELLSNPEASIYLEYKFSF